MPSHSFAMLSPHGDPLGRIGEPDIGGQCVYIRQLSTYLARAGHAVSVFTRDRQDGKPSQEEFAPGATLHRIPCGPPGFIPKEELGPHLTAFADAVRSRLSGEEILHSHYWDGGRVAHLLHERQPWFHTTHSIGKLKEAAVSANAAYRFDERIGVETEVFRECDRILALTEIEKSQINRLYEVPPDRIVVIPPGVDANLFRPVANKGEIRDRLGLPGDRVIVFTLGRLDERKGFDLFFEAAASSQSRDVPPTLYVFSGGDGSAAEAGEREKIQGIIDAANLNSAVKWLPVLPEAKLPLYYGAADLFALPSRYEPFGIVMLEAMACGLPVVATHVGGPRTVIEPDRTGFLIDPTDTEAFADALTTLIKEPSRREVYGANARATVEEAYSWEVIADRHLSAYVDVAGRVGHAR